MRGSPPSFQIRACGWVASCHGLPKKESLAWCIGEEIFLSAGTKCSTYPLRTMTIIQPNWENPFHIHRGAVPSEVWQLSNQARREAPSLSLLLPSFFTRASSPPSQSSLRSDSVYRVRLKDGPQVARILFLLLLTTFASSCLQHSQPGNCNFSPPLYDSFMKVTSKMLWILLECKSDERKYESGSESNLFWVVTSTL